MSWIILVSVFSFSTQQCTQINVWYPLYASICYISMNSGSLLRNEKSRFFKSHIQQIHTAQTLGCRVPIVEALVKRPIKKLCYERTMNTSKKRKISQFSLMGETSGRLLCFVFKNLLVFTWLLLCFSFPLICWLDCFWFSINVIPWQATWTAC